MTTDFTPDAQPARYWAVDDLEGLRFDPLLAQTLREEPVRRVRLPYGEGEAWLVTRHEDVLLVTSDPRFSRAEADRRPVTRMTPHKVALDGAVGFADPPEHTRLRRVVAKAFTSRNIRRLRMWTQDLMDGITEGIRRQGPPADLMARVHVPMPLAVVSELMGVPAGDREPVEGWTQGVLTAGADRAANEHAREQLARYFDALLTARRARPRQDLAGVIAAAAAEGELSHQEAKALCVIIQVSGAHAVSNNSANMVYTLLTRPHLADRLRAQPELLPRAVEELLRWIPHRSGVGLPRIAVSDVLVGGVLIRAGEAVYASYLTANRDPRVFEDPDELDFDREPGAHLAFGHGPHQCMGSALARMESEVMLAALLQDFPGLRLAVPEQEVTWQRRVLIRGPEALPVTG